MRQFPLHPSNHPVTHTRGLRDGLSRVTDVTGLLFFVSAVLFSTFILFLPSSSVLLSYFYLAAPMHKCLGKHSCMSSPFSISHTEWKWNLLSSGTNTYSWLLYGDVPAIKQLNYKQTNSLTTNKLTQLQTNSLTNSDTVVYRDSYAVS